MQGLELEGRKRQSDSALSGSLCEAGEEGEAPEAGGRAEAQRRSDFLRSFLAPRHRSVGSPEAEAGADEAKAGRDALNSNCSQLRCVVSRARRFSSTAQD